MYYAFDGLSEDPVDDLSFDDSILIWSRNIITSMDYYYYDKLEIVTPFIVSVENSNIVDC